MKKVAVALHATEDFDVNSVLNLKNLDFIHVDVMDGQFVNNTMLNLEIFKTLKEKVKIPILAHLMVSYPDEYLNQLAPYSDGIFFHIEIEMEKQSLINKIKKRGNKVGLVVNPPTPISHLQPFLGDLDYVLVMGVNPGWSGQKFIPETIEKVNELARLKSQYSFMIDVDGGVNLENARQLRNADLLSSSSTILKAESPNKVIKQLKHSS
jgi:ribulose-phosphate 3-epimerase